VIAIADVRRTPPLWGLSVGGISLVLLASVGGLVFTTLQGWSLWTVGTAVILPWVPVFVRDLAWVYKRYGWLALFYALVVTQGGHCLEHLVQMVQIHVLGLTGPNARGVFGVLDIEVVHFVWNNWVMLAVGLLLWRFPGNRALRWTAVLAGWHSIEHAYIFWVYLSTGLSGTPGLLSQGGALLGGLPLSRADVHCMYNLIESVPLFVAFFDQVRRTTSVDKSRRVRLQGAQSRV
jgi:hypothetical protein